MSLITVKCPECDGTGKVGYVGRGYYRDNFHNKCKSCNGLGTKLVSESEAKSILLQRQLDRDDQ